MASKSNEVLLPLGPHIITAYAPKIKVEILCDPAEGKTKQQFKDECDINVIMKRYQETGSLEHVQQRQALYADVTSDDFQTAMDIIANANTAFQDLPARVRDRFNNDPEQMLAFVENADNRDEAAELGLLSAEAVEALAAAAAKAEEPVPTATAPKLA